MNWKAQPVKGLLFVVVATLATAVWLLVLAPALGVSEADAGMNWPFSFFFFGFAILAFFEVWPFAGRVKQPWAGFLSGAIAIILTILGWKLLAAWVGDYNAYALLSYAEFWLFTIAWFYHNAPAAKLSQPAKGAFLTVLSAVLGYVVYLIIGAIPQMYIYFIPQWLFFFFADWPIPSSKPYLKGTFWAVVILIGSWLTDIIFKALGAPMDIPRGGDLLSLIFGAMLLTYGLEYWPFATQKQPAQGLALIGTTLGLSAVLYPILFNVFKVPDYFVTIWAFTIWCFLTIILWYTPPWPSEAEA